MSKNITKYYYIVALLHSTKLITTYPAQGPYVVLNVTVYGGTVYGTRRSISPSGKKMYFLKREALHHGKWKLLDIMKNNNRARAKAIRSSRRMQKAGNFFRPLFLTSARGGNELWVQTGSECFTFCYVDKTNVSYCVDCLKMCLTIILIFPQTCVTATW